MDGMSEGGLQLIAAIVDQNARDASYTTNALIDGYIRERDDMARALVTLFDSLATLPENIRTVAIERMLDRVEVARVMAGRCLNEQDGES